MKRRHGRTYALAYLFTSSIESVFEYKMEHEDQRVQLISMMRQFDPSCVEYTGYVVTSKKTVVVFDSITSYHELSHGIDVK